MLGKEALERQLALDYSCSEADIRSDQHIFTQKQYRQGRRMYQDDTALIRAVIVYGKLVVTCRDAALLDWCRSEYADADAPWFLEFENLQKLDEKLRSFGDRLADYHHYYLPAAKSEIRLPDYDFRWYEGSAIDQFRGDSRFGEALCFDEQHPDRLAVTAEKQGEILGMAGASADGSEMWQIGIDVVASARQQGLAGCLTALLKNAVLDRGKIPFYGTVESHIVSQRVAIAAGFVPAWAELYSLPL